MPIVQVGKQMQRTQTKAKRVPTPSPPPVPRPESEPYTPDNFYGQTSPLSPAQELAEQRIGPQGLYKPPGTGQSLQSRIWMALRNRGIYFLRPQDVRDATNLTGQAIWQYGVRPVSISPEVAEGLHFNPQSRYFRSAMQSAFGVNGFRTAADFMEALGYAELEDGTWYRLDPDTGGKGSGSGSGSGSKGSYGGRRGGYSPGPGYSPGRGYVGSNGFVNWRIM